MEHTIIFVTTDNLTTWVNERRAGTTTIPSRNDYVQFVDGEYATGWDIACSQPPVRVLTLMRADEYLRPVGRDR